MRNPVVFSTECRVYLVGLALFLFVGVSHAVTFEVDGAPIAGVDIQGIELTESALKVTLSPTSGPINSPPDAEDPVIPPVNNEAIENYSANIAAACQASVEIAACGGAVGIVTQSQPFVPLEVVGGEILSSDFAITEVGAGAAFFSFVSGSWSVPTLRVWISSTPGGVAIADAACDKEIAGYSQRFNMNVSNGGVSVTNADDVCDIQLETPYFVNVAIKSSLVPAVSVRRSLIISR